MKNTSLAVRFILVLVPILVLWATARSLLLNNIYHLQLRNHASTVADNVISLGDWVSSYGRIWVAENNEEKRFLSTQSVVELNKAEEIATASSNSTGGQSNQLSGHSYTIFSKTPAIAQLEYSETIAASDSNVKFRMTSDNVMNPVNKPNAFELEAMESIKKSGAKYYEHFSSETNEYKYARAIFHKPSCIACHGDPADAPPDVLSRYGAENGFGFKSGDLAGVISVTMPTTLFAVAALPLFTWQEGILVMAALGIAILFLQFSVLRPIKKLTRSADLMSHGNSDDSEFQNIMQNTRNEVGQLALAIKRMNTGMKIAIDQMRDSKDKP